ncbi:MAG TPA: ORF6N domain-containing protein [Methylomirabilota bacterium]|nr:ORF6N domain-containing protein [Methylomirabilota bacterium]
MSKAPQIPVERIERCIVSVRGQRVILDTDIAALYGVPLSALNQAVRRNLERFPSDFIFQLTPQDLANLKSQSVISSLGWGGRRSLQYAFTEHGVAMLSSVLRSPRAIQVNIEIVRTFVKLRRIMASHVDLTRKLGALERKYDAQFKVVFDAIRRLMTPEAPRPRPIGFRHPPSGKSPGPGSRR